MKILNYLFLAFILICSCSQSTQSLNKEKNLTILHKEKMSKNAVNDKYQQIVLSLCDMVYEHEFTELNTCYFDLNVFENYKCFAFASEVVCGASSGSCGLNIQIFKKEKGKYQVVYEACGFNLTRSVESNFNYYSFTYETRGGTKTKVVFNGSSFIEKIVSVNNLDYEKIKLIANKTDYDLHSFSLDDRNLTDNVSNRIAIENINIGPKQTAELFTVQSLPYQYFLFHENRLVFSATDILSLETVKESDTEYYGIATYSLNNSITKFDTSYIIPSIYKYSKKTQRYEINS